MDILKDTTLFPHIEGMALQGREMVVTIRSIVKEKMQGPTGRPVEKNVIVFQETPQTLVLNKTNAKRIITLYGSETNDWPGKRIILYSESVQAFGETTEAVRVGKKAPPPISQNEQVARKQRAKAAVASANDSLIGGEPAGQPPEPPAAGGLFPDELRKQLHAIGGQIYGDAWDDKRPELCLSVSKKRTNRSDQLTGEELEKLIRGMRERANGNGSAPITVTVTTPESRAAEDESVMAQEDAQYES